MSHLKGFSLIELMVVIAIVAVLAAVAAPTYNSYIIKSRSMKVLDVIEGLSQKSILYSQKHGVFANAYNLGLSTTVDATEVDNPAEFLPADYIQGVTYPIIELRDTSDVVPCGQKGSVSVIVDAHALGLREAPASGDGGVVFASGFYNVDGVIKTFNYYYAYADSFPSGYLVGDFVPGWPNMVINDGQTMNPDFEAAGLDVQGAVCQ